MYSSNCYGGLVSYVGGIVGYTSGEISASSYVGEITNKCDNSTTDRSYSYAPGQYYNYPSQAYLGGIAGRTSTNILNCYARIESAYIEAYNHMWIAGIVGYCGYNNNQKTHINNCYAILENVSCVCTHPTFSPKPIYLAGIAAEFSYGEINNCVTINLDLVKNQGNIMLVNSYNKQNLIELQTSGYIESVLNWGIYDDFSSIDNGYVWILVDGNLPKLFFE